LILISKKNPHGSATPRKKKKYRIIVGRETERETRRFLQLQDKLNTGPQKEVGEKRRKT